MVLVAPHTPPVLCLLQMVPPRGAKKTPVLLVRRPGILSPAHSDKQTQPKKHDEMILAAEGVLMQARGE
jgi:hypothetical protein